MKKTLLIALLLIPFLGISQTTKPVEGFLGIKFGSSKEEVIAAVKAKGGQLAPQGKDPDMLSFNNVSLGSRATKGFFVYFIDNKAYRGVMAFRPELEAQTISYYNDLVSDINGVYGPGKSGKQFSEPYSDGDGYEVQAIGLGKAIYLTNWVSGDNGISVNISHQLYILLSYFDGKLNALAEAREKQKQKADF